MQRSGLPGKLLGSDALTNKQRQDLFEIQAPLKQDAKHGEEAGNHFLREKGPQMLELISESLGEDSLTSEQRQELARTASMLAGYRLSF